MIKSAAQKLIERYGRDAPREAGQRAEELRLAGDAEGHRLWLSIREVVMAMLSEPPSGTRH